MTYDYAVSDIPQAGAMSPNAPLFTPTRYPSAVQMSINDTVGNYLAAGVPASKIHVGIPLYGHTWYNPTLNATSWQGFGMPSYVQGSCCGPLAPTNGGKPGVGSSEVRFGRGARPRSLANARSPPPFPPARVPYSAVRHVHV
jgi:GH18 family chitinase